MKSRAGASTWRTTFGVRVWVGVEDIAVLRGKVSRLGCRFQVSGSGSRASSCSLSVCCIKPSTLHTPDGSHELQFTTFPEHGLCTVCVGSKDDRPCSKVEP